MKNKIHYQTETYFTDADALQEIGDLRLERGAVYKRQMLHTLSTLFKVHLRLANRVRSGVVSVGEIGKLAHAMTGSALRYVVTLCLPALPASGRGQR